MKKLLLSSLALGISLSSFAQFSGTSTSLSYVGDGNAAPTTGLASFYTYQYFAGVGVDTYKENTCTTVHDDLGGFDGQVYAAPTDAGDPDNYHPNGGVIFYGGNVARQYSGAGCTSSDPSFGFFLRNSGTIDLSGTGNQRLQFQYQNNTGTTSDISVELQLLATNYAGLLETPVPLTFIGDGQVHDVDIDFSSNVGTGNVSAVMQFSFIYTSTDYSPEIAISINNIKAGSDVTSTSNASSLLSSSKLFPNPTSDNATVELNLKSASDVKITVLDVMGKEVMTVAEGTYSSLSESFSVAGLNKGVYSVNYTVNGTPAKSELLMVK